MKKLAILFFAGALTLTSCTSSKYAAVNSLRNFTTELGTMANNSSSYNQTDWAKARAKYQNINDKISKYEYTSDERSEIGELQGRCVGYLAKGTANTVVDKVKGAVNQVTGIIEGVKQVLKGN